MKDKLRDYADRIEADERAVPVGKVFRGPNGCYIEWAAGADILDYAGASLYTHPARSGVVSDEDVEAALDLLFPYNKRRHTITSERKMRAALEHFAAIAQEKQS